MNKKSDKAALVLFIISLVLVSYGYGVFSERDKFFPISLFYQAELGATQLFEASQAILPWYLIQSDQQQQVLVHNAQAIAPGLTLLGGVANNPGRLGVKIVNQQGDVIYNWDIDWFKLWPDPTHLPQKILPKSKPGTIIHGVAVLDNGDLLFNFEALGLIRLDSCGEVIWRLPYRTHHSVHIDDQGDFWIGGLITHAEKVKKYPNHFPSFDESTILKVSAEGEILDEISIFDLLIDNGLQGLLYLRTLNNSSTAVMGDSLHLNDVELFPDNLKPGFFVPGDVMISLRDINAILVFNLQDKKIKFKSIGAVLRQHDPDFMDGNTISIFDNNNYIAGTENRYSRIVSISALDEQVEQLFTGSKQQPFFSPFYGKHQNLINGNTLIAEPTKGRAFEIDPQGNIVWEYFNIIKPGVLGIMNEAQRLPAKFNQTFFEKQTAHCQAIQVAKQKNGKGVSSEKFN